MEDCQIEEPNRERQWPVVPCPGCGVIDLEDCQCVSRSINEIDKIIMESKR